jgi:hypothetical protein
VAVSKAIQAFPPPFNFVAAGLVAAAEAAQAAKVAGISFATGGVFGGFNGASLGPDNTTAYVRTGEMILNARQQRNLFDIANTGTGATSSNIEELLGRLITAIESQPVIVNVGGKTVVDTLRSELDSGRTF